MLRTLLKFSRTHCQLMGAILVLVSSTRHPPHRAASRGNLVLRLWRQYARQRLSPVARHVSSRVAPGSGPGIPVRFNLEGRPRGKADPPICAPIRPQRSGASFTRSRAATSFVWTRRKAFRGGSANLNSGLSGIFA